MIERYAIAEMAALFSDEARLKGWLEVELLAAEACAELGLVDPEHVAAARKAAPVVDEDLVTAVAEREAVTDHDVAAFVDVVQAAIGMPASSVVHFGLTSSDVVDTALSVTLVRAADLLIEACGALVSSLERRAVEHAGTVMLGRTHGMHAEPTTFGAKLALFALAVGRDLERLKRARGAVAVGKLSGAVGTYSNIDPRVEASVCHALGLEAVPASQVIGRDRHAEFLYACASVGATIEQLAVELRHLQRSEVQEVQEAFAAGQKGSSAMPHKRNPITSERCSGLARVLRGYLVAGLEDVALWHERDISHSSVERIVLPDASQLAYYVLITMTKVVDGLVVDTERMRRNLVDGSLGLVFSQSVLLTLVNSGLSRDDAYRITQRDAARAAASNEQLRAVLDADPEVTSVVSQAALDRAFDLGRVLTHAGRAIDAIRAHRASEEGPWDELVQELDPDQPRDRVAE
jgi:adenylosuccinate lyase